MEFLENFEAEYQRSGGKVIINGFEQFELFSDHPLSGRKSGGKVIINGFEQFELFSDHPLSGRKIRK
jgi:hypothetical protein